MINFPEIAATALQNSLGFLETYLPGGKIDGHEYVTLNPTRADKHAGSFRINIHTGSWADFATDDKGGDLISLYAYINGVKMGEAARAISGQILPEKKQKPAFDKTAFDKTAFDKTAWEQVAPMPINVLALPVKWKLKTETGFADVNFISWPYHDKAGCVVGYVIRYEINGHKETPFVSLCRNKTTGAYKWIKRGIKKNRPLFNLPGIIRNPAAQIIVVEGEKCADVLQSHLDSAGIKNIVATCWIGGVNGLALSDWTPLHDKKIILWPDFDKQENTSADEQPGYSAMVRISAILSGRCKIRIVSPDPDKPDGWDVADALMIDRWNVQQVFNYIKPRLAKRTGKNEA